MDNTKYGNHSLNGQFDSYLILFFLMIEIYTYNLQYIHVTEFDF